MPDSGVPGPTAGGEVYPLLPLRGMIVFPHVVTPLEVGRQRSLYAVETAAVQDRKIVLVAQKEAHIDEPELHDLYSVGVLAEIKQILKMPEGQVRILVEGLARVRIESVHQHDPFYLVGVTGVSGTPGQDADETETLALMRTAARQFDRYVRLSKKLPLEVLQSVTELSDADRLADTLAAQLPLEVAEKQRLLEMAGARDRLEQLCFIMTREMEIIELEKRIQVRVRKQMERSQKEYYLREQIKAIQQELGEKDDRQAEVEELREKIASAQMPPEVREKAERELKRLLRMQPVSAEAAVVRTYLDWLIELPWRKQTEDRLDLRVAEEIINRDHYGMEKVKERVLEFLAVRQLARNLQGPILCLVGPPGVGKTSLARSIAEALDRKFERLSLGGVRDEAEIRGHRRTYVGAMPGKIIQAMRRAGTRNPVLLLDEVDKMSYDFRGDPAAALLEVLDPEQNSTFADHYLEVPFDLSNVMFITTANVVHGIPRALRDRMEVISIPGYTEEEKLKIAVRHLLPKQKAAHGLEEGHLSVSENALRRIITEYTREAGVRELQRHLATLCRKSARQIVEQTGGRAGPAGGAPKTLRIDARNLERYLGAPRYHRARRETTDRVGLANGLAYTDTGGELMVVEVAVVRGRGQLLLTGKLGEVMRESAQAGFSYLRSRAAELGIDPGFYEQYDVHIHVPEGAIPKDGPSAGSTIAVALLSAIRGVPVRNDVAMTGEITLRGRILPVGGIKEKVLAARRAGITTVALPVDNEKDLEEIPEEVRRELEFVLVSDMEELFAVAFPPDVRWSGNEVAAADDQAAGGGNETGSSVGTPVPYVPPPDTETWVEDNPR